MRSETAGRAMLLGLLVLTLYLMYRIFLPFIPGIAWAIVLVVVFRPVYDRLVIWLHGRDVLAAWIVSVAVAAFVVVPMLFAIVHLARGVVSAYAWMQAELAAGRSPLDLARQVPAFGRVLEVVGRYVDLRQVDLQRMSLTTLQSVGNYLGGQARALVANLFHTLLTLIVVLVTMVVLFLRAPALSAAVQRLLPLSEADKKAVFQELHSATRAIFYGVVMTAAVQAVLGTVGFAIAGVPLPVLFGAAMFFAAMLPSGTVVVWLPLTIWLFVSGRTGRGVFLLIWGAGVVSTVDNFLRPVFIGRGLRMHMLLVFFGTLGGVIAFGLIGLFTGPLVITVFLFLLEVARRDLLRPGPAEPLPVDAASPPAPLP
jgi:predicted PurR-regulated permease PerM